MTTSRVAFVDVYPIRLTGGSLEVLVLRRSPTTRCPGAWEVVHGTIEPGELPAAAALRELREEAGLDPIRFYNLSRVESFYLHRTDEVALVPVFVAVVGSDAVARLSNEHDQAEWVSFELAQTRLAWPRERRALRDIAVILPSGNAGSLEDVLRIPLGTVAPKAIL